MKLVFLSAVLVSTTVAQAWAPKQIAPDMPLSSFVLPAGLEITPWAASPMLFNPTNFDIDHLGRIWVAEGVNYRSKANRQPKGDRIVVLEDTDDDGKADHSRVFWQDPELVSPLGIAVFDNVVIVSQPPNLLKLTDVNRDLKFDLADGDTREVLLTGFNGKNHDHSLHSLTAGPDGKWYFNQGNTGGVFTDKSGKIFRVGSCYSDSGAAEWPVETKSISGQKSDDGFVYVGGFTVRMNPDATHTEIVGHNYRNSYEQAINSRGFVFQSDNDDPPACRVSHVIEHGSAGYFSSDGRRTWEADLRPGQDIPTAEWRQENPGSMPAGDVYGGGSPTGVAYYENGALGEAFIGTLLCCEAARNSIFSYQPTHNGAGFNLMRSDFITSNPEKSFTGADFIGGTTKQPETDEKEKFNFRPADVCIGPDGALYVADWTDPRVGGHDTQDDAASGIIYRIAPKGFKSAVPKLDLNSLEGAISALKSPAVNVRYLGFQKLKFAGTAAYQAVAKTLEDPNPYIAARAIWLMPYLGEKGVGMLNQLISSEKAADRLTAFRAIRRTDGLIDDLPFACKLAADPAPEIRVEAAQAMRYRSFKQACDTLVIVALQYDGKDRSYLESFGIGAGQNTAELWQAIERQIKPSSALEWSNAFAQITWQLMPEASIPSLKLRAVASSLSEEQRKLALDSIAFIKSKSSAAALMDLAVENSPVKTQALWWLKNRCEGEWSEFLLKPELIKRGLFKEEAPLVEITIPPRPQTNSYTVAEVIALKGDPTRGKVAANRCLMCHKIDQAGPDYGPALKGFANRQATEVVVRSIVEPSFDISHGFEGTTIVLKNRMKIEGRILSDEDPLIIQSTGGVTQRVPRNQIASHSTMDRSLMLGADQLALSPQDVADVVEWLKTY